MPAGFRLTNNDLVYQVTDEVPNYGLDTIVTSDFSSAGPFQDSAVYAFQPTASFMSQHIDGSENGRCFVFAPCNEISYTRPTSGMVGDVRNSSNELMFSVNLRPLVVVDLVEWSSSTPSAENVVTLESGRDYAVIYLAETINEYGNSTLTGIDGEDAESYHNTNTRRVVTFKVEDNVITFKVEDIEFESWDSTETSGGSGIFIPALAFNGFYLGSGTVTVKALIIDVTGL